MNHSLRQLREERGLTLEDLADQVGLSKGFLSQIETGARNASVQSIKRLAEVLHVPAADLIPTTGFSEPRTPPMSAARRALMNLDQPETTEPEFKLGTDGTMVQIIATVDREGLDRLIKQLEAMKLFLDAGKGGTCS